MKQILFAITLLIACCFNADAFNLINNPVENIQPAIKFSPDESGITVSYTFIGALKTEDDVFPGMYSLSIPGFASNMTSGEPAWLTRWDTFELPYGNDAEIELLSSSTITFPLILAPSREPLEDRNNIPYSAENIAPISDFSGWMPASAISNDGIQTYRDRNILYVGVFPVSYNQNEGKTKICESLTYRINFVPSKNKKSSKSPMELHSADDTFMKSVFSCILPTTDTDNILMSKENSFNIKPIWIPGPDYLILSVPKYTTAVSKFAQWKKQMGYNVYVVNKSSWTTSTIKQEIHSRYEANSNLCYLLLFGDEIDLPGDSIKVPGTKYPFYSDFNYGCLDGDEDQLQDLTVGRISITSLAEANTVVNKIIDYENKSFLSRKGLHCAEFSDNRYNDTYEDRRFVRTSEDIANGMEYLGRNTERVYYYNNYDPITSPNPIYHKPLFWNNKTYSYGEPLPEFLLNEDFNWSGNAQDICNSINNGVQYVLHRDHGTIESWSLPSFSINNINSLTNGKKTPIVFSMNCLTGMFQHIKNSAYSSPKDWNESTNQSTCFAEAFLRKSNGGCVGIMAASQISYSGYNDVLTMEMFQEIWPNSNFLHSFPGYSPIKSSVTIPLRRMGDVLTAGKFNLMQYFMPTSAFTKYTTRIFHWLGDPTMEIVDDEFLLSPYLTVRENPIDFISSEKSYTLNTGMKVKLSKVNVYTSAVSVATGSNFSIPSGDISQHRFYISGDNIRPQEVNLGLLISSISHGEIISSVQEGSILRVKYSVPNETDNIEVSLKSVVSGIEKIADINYDSEACFYLSDKENGVYIIELRNKSEVIDTNKLIIK